jgi:hypothetical protein
MKAGIFLAWVRAEREESTDAFQGVPNPSSAGKRKNLPA